MTLISDEAVEAAWERVIDGTPPTTQAPSRETVKAALTEALPHIVEGMARDAEECAGVHKAQGRCGASAVLIDHAGHLRSLAPMGER